MLAIVGGKGGCGKTTTAVGLGVAFADKGRRVLLVDVDSDTPDLHTVTHCPYSPGIGTLHEDASLARTVHRSPVYPGVDVLPSGSWTGAVPPDVLDRVREYPGRVVVDCPAGASSAVTEPAAAAEAALVVSTPQVQSQRDAVKTARMVRSLGTRVTGAVVTRADSTFARSRGPLGEECRVLETIPPVEGPVPARSVGRPAYRRLSNYLAKRNV